MGTPHPVMLDDHKECPSCHDNGIIYIKAGIPNEALPCPKRCESWKWLLDRGQVQVCPECERVITVKQPCPFCKPKPRGRPVNPDSKARRKSNKDSAEVADRRARCGLPPEDERHVHDLDAQGGTFL